MADAKTWPKERKGLKNKPPPNSITKTADLVRRLLTVPKAELEEQELKWKRRRMRPKAERRVRT
jgi:hypothetical protein